MRLKPDTVYRVTKGNTDGSLKIGDLIYIDSHDDSLVCDIGGWLGKEELTPDVMDFAYEESREYKLVRDPWHCTYITKVNT